MSNVESSTQTLPTAEGVSQNPTYSVYDLVDLLKQIELSDEVAQGDRSENGIRYLTDGVRAYLPKSIQEALSAAEQTLVSPEGGCNWLAHRVLSQFGFNVTPGETDSFGWLTGCIHTKKGVIVYG